eukprot:TRINITY_DN8090_c0_g1_i1.p1 TRINITY_DN8090_c0_g1~~TRINITY_DN8090_c0_g1_i1.p1  ORF type:complete len:628 (-),score=108.25 TRINITY_DN8090_c0_g1_i1:13-1896(-)
MNDEKPLIHTSQSEVHYYNSNRKGYTRVGAWVFGIILFVCFSSIVFYFVAFPPYKGIYKKTVKMIEMRDGIKLYTEIYTPRSMSHRKLPILLRRSPYEWRYIDGISKVVDPMYNDLNKDGYHIVLQYIRGTVKSEGVFVMMRTPTNGTGVSETTDAYDTLEWCLENIKNNNGKSGILGISYTGFTTIESIIDKHPSIKAISPQAPPIDMWIGDDFGQNGILRLSPSFGYSYKMESIYPHFDFKGKDVYSFFLELGPLKNVNLKYFHHQFPSWNALMEHPNYDDYWKSLNVNQHVNDLEIPSLSVSGYFDAENIYGNWEAYKHFESINSKDNFMIIGPWPHGGWSIPYEGMFTPDGSHFGPIEFNNATSDYFKEIQRQFFYHYLHENFDFPHKKVISFRTGENKWHEYKNWAPSKVEKLYLNDGIVSFFPPTNLNQTMCIISDPSNPIPYYPRPIKGFWQDGLAKRDWKLVNQAFLNDRDDIITFKSEPLNTEYRITGEVIASIRAISNGTDADWFVKIIDQYPDSGDHNLNGYMWMLSNRGIRAKYRNSFSHPEPINDDIIEYEIDMFKMDHVFKEDHRIVVQIQNTMFPLFDRNPQKFVDIPLANASDYQVAENCVYTSTITINKL